MKTRTIIGVAITIAVVAGLMVVIPPSEVLPHLKSTEPFYLGLACIVNFCTIALRAKRWHVLVSSLKKLPFAEIFRLLMAGIAVNSVIPLRAGEAMRAYSLSSRWDVSKREAVSTVLVDKSFDAISFGLLLLVATRIFDLPPVMSGRTYGLAFSSIALILSFPIVARLGRSVRDQPKERFSSELQRKIAMKLEPLSRGYASLTTRASVLSALLSFGAWAAQVVVAVLVARSVGVTLPLGAVVMAVFAVNAASTLPLTPANIGVFQIAFLVTLSAYGFNRSSSFAIAALFQAVLVIPVTVIGLILLNHRRRMRVSATS